MTEDNPKNAPDRDMTFGLYLNNQLQNLSHDQKIYAEKLMSDVLFLARTNQLNATSRIFTRPSSQTTTTLNEYSSSPIQFVNSPSPYAENVRSPPNIQRPISQNSAHSASPICHNSPYSEDLPSSPNIQTSSPITIIKRPASQNLTYFSTPIQYSSTSKGCIETQLSHIPSSQTVLSANSLTQYQDTSQELPNTQFSSIPIILDNETENSTPVHTEQLNKFLVFRKK